MESRVTLLPGHGTADPKPSILPRITIRKITQDLIIQPKRAPVGVASAAELEKYRDRLQAVYGADGEWFVCSTVSEGTGSLAELETWLKDRLPEA